MAQPYKHGRITIDVVGSALQYRNKEDNSNTFVAATGDLRATKNNRLKWKCAHPFELVLEDYTYAPHAWDLPAAFEPVAVPFASPFKESAPYPLNPAAGGGWEMKLHVAAHPGSGEYKFTVRVTLPDGTVVEDDPRILID